MLDSLFLFHVAVRVAALSAVELKMSSPTTASARRTYALRFPTRERPHSESVSIMERTIV